MFHCVLLFGFSCYCVCFLLYADASDRYPYSIIWGSLPVITWLFPFIGHMGIADSDGIVHDFAGM